MYILHFKLENDLKLLHEFCCFGHASKIFVEWLLQVKPVKLAIQKPNI